MIPRAFSDVLQTKLHKGKAIILIGPRQVGKTTLIRTLLKDKKFLFLDGDDATVVEILSNANTETLRSIISDYKYVFIDEAQRIPHIGLKLKIIVDQIKEVHLISVMKFKNRLQGVNLNTIYFLFLGTNLKTIQDILKLNNN